MSSHVVTIRLPEALGERLDLLAKRTHRSKAFYAREAIEQHLEDIEDAYLASEISRQVATGEMPTRELSGLRRDFGAEGDPDLSLLENIQ
ncbi:type II toxin-antitoxin system RelB family antitoxin [Leucobacter sp. HY1910]